MRDLVLGRTLSGLDLSVPYDEHDDGDQISQATAFLINIPQRVVFARVRSFMDSRPYDFFDVEHADARHKGCWVVRAVGKPQNFQFKIYWAGRNHSFTLNRLAVRLWHDEASVLRLLISRDHEAVRLCHNNHCMRPDHIAVENSKERADRRSCRREGRCGRHWMWSKCGMERERRRCIFAHPQGEAGR